MCKVIALGGRRRRGDPRPRPGGRAGRHPLLQQPRDSQGQPRRHLRGRSRGAASPQARRVDRTTVMAYTRGTWRYGYTDSNNMEHLTWRDRGGKRVDVTRFLS